MLELIVFRLAGGSMAAIGRLPRGVVLRQIQPQDRDGVIACLHRGFGERDLSYWGRAFDRLAARPCVRDLPRFGFAIEAEGRIVGVLLTLYVDGAAHEVGVRCNLAGLTLDPPFRPYAGKLVSHALADPTVTYTNVTPARSTWPALKVLGFRHFSGGQMVFVPLLTPARGRITAFDRNSDAAAKLGDLERHVLAEHAALGCTALVWSHGEAVEPLLLTPKTIANGNLRCMQIVYCRSSQGVVCGAGALGRYLMRRGALFCLIDTSAPIRGLRGRYFPDRGPKFYRGPNPPAPGDLSFTEIALFGA